MKWVYVAWHQMEPRRMGLHYRVLRNLLLLTSLANTPSQFNLVPTTRYGPRFMIPLPIRKLMENKLSFILTMTMRTPASCFWHRFFTQAENVWRRFSAMPGPTLSFAWHPTTLSIVKTLPTSAFSSTEVYIVPELCMILSISSLKFFL